MSAQLTEVYDSVLQIFSQTLLIPFRQDCIANDFSSNQVGHLIWTFRRVLSHTVKKVMPKTDTLGCFASRSDEPGAWFAMLPLEIVYDFDPIPPRPCYQHSETQKTIQSPPSSPEEANGIDVEVELEIETQEDGIRRMSGDADNIGEEDRLSDNAMDSQPHESGNFDGMSVTQGISTFHSSAGAWFRMMNDRSLDDNPIIVVPCTTSVLKCFTLSSHPFWEMTSHQLTRETLRSLQRHHLQILAISTTLHPSCEW